MNLRRIATKIWGEICTKIEEKFFGVFSLWWAEEAVDKFLNPIPWMRVSSNALLPTPKARLQKSLWNPQAAKTLLSNSHGFLTNPLSITPFLEKRTDRSYYYLYTSEHLVEPGWSCSDSSHLFWGLKWEMKSELDSRQVFWGLNWQMTSELDSRQLFWG